MEVMKAAASFALFEVQRVLDARSEALLDPAFVRSPITLTCGEGTIDDL